MKFNFLLILLFVSCAQVKKLGLEKKLKDIELGSPVKNIEHFRLAWAKNLDPDYSTGNFPIGTSSPFIFDDIIYMGSLKAEMQAFDLESGRLIWKQQENGPIQSQVQKVDKYIYYGTKEGRLISRHYYTGELNFSVDLGAPIESQPSFIQGRLVIHLRNHSIIVLDARTGKVFWRYKRSVPYSTTLQRVSPVNSYEGSILVGFADGFLGLLSLEEGVIKWEQKVSTGVKFVDIDVQPIEVDNYIVAGSAGGPLRFLNPVNGAIEKTVEIIQSNTPLKEEGTFLVGGIYGSLYRVSNQGKILQTVKISKDAISSIKLWKRGLVVTTMGSAVFYLDSVNLKVLDSFNLGSDQSAVFGEAMVGDNGFLAIYSSRNRLYVFGQ